MRGEKVHNLETETIYKVVGQLIGIYKPQGESNFDAKAYENLEILLGLTEMLITDIDDVAYLNCNRTEASIKKIGALANEWCKKHLAE